MLSLGSDQQLLRRLQLLYHHGYLDRPRAQIDYYRRGSQPMVYGLGNKGMQLLEKEEGISHRKLDWTSRNRSISRYFMEHALAVADTMVALHRSCLAKGIHLIRHADGSLNPVKWKVVVNHNGSRLVTGVVPDQVFGLKAGGDTRWYFLEADRATMPVERNNLRQTSFHRKVVAYLETWRQKALKDSFPRFQVLTVTTSRERVKNLIEATGRITRNQGAGLFLFTDERAFVEAEDIFNISLLNGRGETVALLD